MFAPSRPNKGRQKEVTAVDVKLMRLANTLGGGGQQIPGKPGKKPEELDLEPVETEEDRVLLRRDNLSRVDLHKYNTGEIEVQYV